MVMSATTKAVLLTATFSLLAALAGCASAAAPKSPGLIVDAAHPIRTMEHWKAVDDPFAPAAATQPARPVEKVLKAGSMGPPEPYSHHGQFLDDRGLFKMPASGKAELRIVLGVVKLKDVQVQIIAAGPPGKMKITQTVPATDRWQEIVLKLDPAKLKPGSAIRDITFSQMGQDKDSRLYVKSITLRTE
jgi:hypothetical protein